MEITEKMCSKCLIVKPATEFHKDSKALGGLRSICKECANEKAKKYRKENPEIISEKRKENYQKNKEEILEKRKEYYEENKEEILEKRKEEYRENKDKIDQKNRESYHRNKEKRAAQKKNYREENKEKIKQHDKEYRDSHKEQKRAYRQSLQGKWVHYKSTAKRRHHEFSLTFEEFSSFWQKPCHYCGCQVDTICLDRIDSSKGYTMDNVVPSCIPHNLMKLDTSKEEFIELCRSVVKHFDEQ